MYNEQRTMWWTWLIVILAAGGTAAYGAAVARAVARGGLLDVGAVAAFGASGLGLILLWWAAVAFARYSVRLDRGALTFGFSWWSVTLPLSEIETAARYDGGLWRFGGLGWRLGPRGQIGYLASFGPAVKLTTRWGRTYVFSCRRPERLLEALASCGVACDRPQAEQ